MDPESNEERLKKVIKQTKVAASLLIRRDLELTRANEKLRELDKTKSQFISVVAHQLRTPLSGVKWCLRMLLDGDVGALTKEQQDFLARGYEANDRMINLVNDMLSVDRLESGTEKYVFAPTKITDLIDEVLFDLMDATKKKDLDVTLNYCSDDLPKANLDKESMHAALQNLIENAVKYTTEKGKIEIAVCTDEKMLKISIKDNGIGIPESQEDNLFSRFFRARNAVHMHTSGSGLGLYIVKNIIQRHRGRIWYEKNSEKGSIFHFTIPIVSEETPSK